MSLEKGKTVAKLAVKDTLFSVTVIVIFVRIFHDSWDFMLFLAVIMLAPAIFIGTFIVLVINAEEKSAKKVLRTVIVDIAFSSTIAAGASILLVFMFDLMRNETGEALEGILGGLFIAGISSICAGICGAIISNVMLHRYFLLKKE